MAVVAVTTTVGLAPLGSMIDLLVRGITVPTLAFQWGAGHVLSLMKLLTDSSAHDSELLFCIEVGVFLATVENLAERAQECLIRRVETSKTISVTKLAFGCVSAACTCAQSVEMMIVGALLAIEGTESVASAKLRSRGK